MGDNFLDTDLSDCILEKKDFSACNIKNATFFKVDNEKKELHDINFSGSSVIDVDFSKANLKCINFKNAKLKNCRFDSSKLNNINFEKAELINCRFRSAVISNSNFKYTHINLATFEDADINFCDFYRTFFSGIVVFRDCKIKDCSLHYTYFSEGAIIRRDNLVGDRILQQNKDNYKHFLVEARDTATYQIGWDVESSLFERYKDAEDIYRSLSGFWLNKGYMGDSNWAYVQARRMERKKWWNELTKNKIIKEEDKLIERNEIVFFLQKINLIGSISLNWLYDFLWGYGESLYKIIRTFILMIFIFSLLYQILLPFSYTQSLVLSIISMLPTTAELTNISPTIDSLIVIQTTLSILLTGVLGFILANKIRHQ